jgi:membrane protease YdiL (CAAX protease family)
MIAATSAVEKGAIPMIPEPPPPAAPEAEAVVTPVAPPSPWGAWVTIGFLLLIIAVVMGVQTVIVLAWVFAEITRDPSARVETLAEGLQFDGDLLAVTTLVGGAAAVGLVALLVRSRNAALRDYLALEPVRPKTAVLWMLGTLAFLASYDIVSEALDRPTVPDFMIRAYGSAGLLPLLWIAVAVVAPVWEEIVFRGFGFRGLRASRLGLAAAVGVPTLLWACLHLQYDLFDIAYVFCLGVVFGLARERTGTVTMPIVLHVLTNALATLQVALR